jgi:zinc and cadmium transporter
MIIGASLLGGWLPQRFELSHTRMQMIISLIAGLMLAIGVFHMLPHAVVELGDDGPDKAAVGMMAGLVGMFLILRLFAFHQHSPPQAFVHGHSTSKGHGHSELRNPAAPYDAAHSHSLSPAPGAHSLSWVGVCLGMGLHTLIDGLALGASVESDAMRGVAGFCGLGTFLAVFLHKPIDSVSITSLMAIAGWSSRSQTWANSAFSLICPLGAGLFVLGLHEFSGSQSTIVGYALAASAGVFLCIALSDLLPEMEYHSHNRVQLTAALIAGIVLGWATHLLDPAHEHAHAHSEGAGAKQGTTDVMGAG